MKQKEFEEEYKKIRIKNDINLMTDLICLYKKKYKKSVSLKTIYNELHDTYEYTEEEEQYIINQSNNRSKEQE